MEEKEISLIESITNELSTKAQIEKFAETVVMNCCAENLSPLEVAVIIKKAEKAFDLIKEKINDWAIEELRIKQVNECLGCKVSVVDSGVKYDYSVCESSEWFALEDAIVKLRNRQKELENILKKINSSSTLRDGRTGELLKPPAVTCKKTLKITM